MSDWGNICRKYLPEVGNWFALIFQYKDLYVYCNRQPFYYQKEKVSIVLLFILIDLLFINNILASGNSNWLQNLVHWIFFNSCLDLFIPPLKCLKILIKASLEWYLTQHNWTSSFKPKLRTNSYIYVQPWNETFFLHMIDQNQQGGDSIFMEQKAANFIVDSGDIASKFTFHLSLKLPESLFIPVLVWERCITRNVLSIHALEKIFWL